jgi:acetyl-CoA C-acetyltransferase
LDKNQGSEFFMDTHVVVAGWAQVTQPKETQNPKDPLALMIQAAENAGRTLADPSVLTRLDGILVVRPLSAHCPDAPVRVAQALGAVPKFSHISHIGGNSPQTLINQAGSLIAQNELERVLVVGAEAYVRRDTDGHRPESALLQGIPEDYAGEDALGATELENRHGIRHPMQGFALFETALWHASGLELHPYLEKVGNMWAQFSRVAAGHPYAWSRVPRTAREIITPSPENRPVAFPYTKFMNAFITVDQAAAVILMSERAAGAGQKKDRRPVYFLGGGYARDRQRFMVEKSDFTASVPLKTAVDKAMDRAGLTLDQVDCFDFYSCFPCAVSIAKKMNGLSDTDPRPLTLTGGLGFFGGPGNNYNLHAVVTLAELLSTGRYRTGLVTALGWFMHKHAAGIYSTRRPEKSLAGTAEDDHENPLAGPEPVPIDTAPAGNGVIETYTIVYHPDHTPAYGVIYGLTSQGRRFVANTARSPDVFAALSGRNMVGRPVRLSSDPVTGITTAFI